MVESSMDGLRNDFVSTILGDGAACADDDFLINDLDAQSVVEED